MDRRGEIDYIGILKNKCNILCFITGDGGGKDAFNALWGRSRLSGLWRGRRPSVESSVHSGLLCSVGCSLASGAR